MLVNHSVHQQAIQVLVSHASTGFASLLCMQALDHQLRQRETALTTAEHRVELLRTRLENDASTTQKAAQAVEAERAQIQVPRAAWHLEM